MEGSGPPRADSLCPFRARDELDGDGDGCRPSVFWLSISIHLPLTSHIYLSHSLSSLLLGPPLPCPRAAAVRPVLAPSLRRAGRPFPAISSPSPYLHFISSFI